MKTPIKLLKLNRPHKKTLKQNNLPKQSTGNKKS